MDYESDSPTVQIEASLRREGRSLTLSKVKTPTSVDPSNVRRDLHIVARRAGLEGVHPHLLRHAAASLLSAAGVPLEDISDTLGHRSIAVTAEIYRHPIAPVRSGHLAAVTAATAR